MCEAGRPAVALMLVSTDPWATCARDAARAAVADLTLVKRGGACFSPTSTLVMLSRFFPGRQRLQLDEYSAALP
jgi:hypothetical protein